MVCELLFAVREESVFRELKLSLAHEGAVPGGVVYDADVHLGAKLGKLKFKSLGHLVGGIRVIGGQGELERLAP